MNASVFSSVLEGFQLVICVFYPIWCSYKVVEAKKFDNDLVLWLSFWVIQAIVLKAEDIVSACVMLLLGRLPLISMYKLLRICLFVWLMHPNYQGALWIYYGYVQRFFSDFEEPIRTKTKISIEFLFSKLKHLDRRVKEATKTSEPPKEFGKSLTMTHLSDEVLTVPQPNRKTSM